MENTHAQGWRRKKSSERRLGYAGSQLIQYKSNEVYYESDLVFFEAAECAGRRPVKWRVQVIMLYILQNVQLWGKMTSIRIAQLVPMKIICPREKQPSLKTITCPMAFDELGMNFITAFQVFFCVCACEIWWCFRMLKLMNNLLRWPKEAHRVHSGWDGQFTLHLCKLYQTGESIVAPAEREPEHKKKQGKKSVKPVALTYLTAMSWIVRAFEVDAWLFFLSPPPLLSILTVSLSTFRVLCKSQPAQEESNAFSLRSHSVSKLLFCYHPKMER